MKPVTEVFPVTHHDRRQGKYLNIRMDEESIEALKRIAARKGTTWGRLAKRVLWSFIEAAEQEVNIEKDRD